MSTTNRLLSGIEINQNKANDFTSLGLVPLYQEFTLPEDIRRGSTIDNTRLPELTGFSILVSVPAGQKDSVAFDWELQRDIFGTGWASLATGTSVGAAIEADKVWIDVYFTDLITIDSNLVRSSLRLKIVGRTVTIPETKIIEFANGFVTIDNTNVPADFKTTNKILFNFNTVPSILRYDIQTGKITYAKQTNPAKIWFGEFNSQIYRPAYREPEVVIESGFPTLCFKLLTASGDEGKDFLGNTYRHSLFMHKVGNVSTVDGELSDAYWFSKPNPSQFAIENLYFDLSTSGQEAVIDSVLVDPITPDVYFHVYHSSEGNPETTAAKWDEKLWTRVGRTFQAKRRDTYALPEPISAKYIKVEFSHLQPRPYQPGPFQTEVRYQKHPKWVLDYFLARVEAETMSEDRFVARRVDVVYDALDLAYNYYLDDIEQRPENPVQFKESASQQVQKFFQTRTDISDQADSDTLARINLALQPYSGEGGILSFVKLNSIYSTFGDANPSDFATGGNSEFISNSIGQRGPDVSSLNRDKVVLEQSYPVMFFFLTARHRYREVESSFTHNRAYFVGIREIAFLRERYSEATDTNLYVEIGGDSINLQYSDFVRKNNSLVIPG